MRKKAPEAGEAPSVILDGDQEASSAGAGGEGVGEEDWQGIGQKGNSV